MHKFYNSVRLKLMLLCLAALFAIIAAVHIAMYIVSKDIITEQIGLSAQSTAMAISGGIMEDINGYKRFLETRDVNSDYYRRMQEYFVNVKSGSGIIRFIYTERQIDDETVEFILDAEPIGSADYSAPGDTTFMDEASRQVYATRHPAKLEPTVHPKYGTLLGGCAPIFDTNGELLGLTGVNLDISEMLTHLNSLQFILLILYAIILAVCLFLLNRYSGVILEPMVKDRMTGAYTKRYYDTLMRRELEIAEKNGTDLSLLMLDLDHFKKVNDTYGHPFGDRVLEAVAKIIMRCLRADDCLVRYGGEEFAVIIPNADREAVAKIAERIRTSVEKAEIRNEERGIAVKITISIGVSHLDGQHYPANQLMEQADKALYKAKETRNAVSLYTEQEPGGDA